MKHMLLRVGVVLGLSLSVTLPGHAFSVGEIEVKSHLNAPFVAEVPLILKPHERDEGFVVVIGDERDYTSEGVVRAPVIETLRPSVIMGTMDVIRIISTTPIEVPAFDLLLLVRTGRVTIVQNYPVVLATAPKPAPMVATETPPIKKKPIVEAEPPAPTISRAGATKRTAPTVEGAWLANLPEQYGPILRGEALYKVMKRLRVPKSYTWRVAVRIWEHNQGRFVRGNLHGLQVGVYLQIPPDLADSLSQISPRKAKQMVAEQWDTWRKPSQMVVASAVLAKRNAVASAPAKPAEQAPESMVFPSKVDVEPPVKMADLESMLQGFEKRLAQRLSLPTADIEAPEAQAITFVSTDDLQTAIQGLEARLIAQLDTGSRIAGTLPPKSEPRQPTIRVGMETALASFLAADSLVYVFIVQNALLLLLAAGVTWRWFRKRV